MSKSVLFAAVCLCLAGCQVGSQVDHLPASQNDARGGNVGQVSIGQPDDGAVAAMLAVVDEYEKAANTGNIEAFERVLALDDPRFSEFEDFIPELIGRQRVYEILNWRKQHPEFVYEVSYMDCRAFLLSDSVGYVTATAKSKSDHSEGTARVTFILVKDDRQWKIIHGHWSEQPQPDDSAD